MISLPCGLRPSARLSPTSDRLCSKAAPLLVALTSHSWSGCCHYETAHESEILRRVASESRLFGLTAGGTTGAWPDSNCRPRIGHHIFSPLLPELQTSVYVLDDLSIIAPGPITTGTAQFLAQISRLETRGLAPKRRLDPSLILRAVATGTTVESIVTRLTELSLTPVSAAVTSTIADIANNGRFITLNGTGTDTAAKAWHPELGAMLLSDPRLQRLAPVKVDDLTMLYGASRLRVETALVEESITVVAPRRNPSLSTPLSRPHCWNLQKAFSRRGLGLPTSNALLSRQARLAARSPCLLKRARETKQSLSNLATWQTDESAGSTLSPTSNGRFPSLPSSSF